MMSLGGGDGVGGGGGCAQVEGVLKFLTLKLVSTTEKNQVVFMTMMAMTMTRKELRGDQFASAKRLLCRLLLSLLFVDIDHHHRHCHHRRRRPIIINNNNNKNKNKSTPLDMQPQSYVVPVYDFFMELIDSLNAVAPAGLKSMKAVQTGWDPDGEARSGALLQRGLCWIKVFC